MSKSNKAAAFLANMNIPQAEPAQAAVRSMSKSSKAKETAKSRKNLKHIGGYFDAGTVERVAILRARLSLDNSELIKLAVDELYSRQKAKRAFSD